MREWATCPHDARDCFDGRSVPWHGVCTGWVPASDRQRSFEGKGAAMRKRQLLAAIFTGLLICSPVQAAIITLEAVLTGANEVPGPGDPDGSGHATFTIDTIALTVIWDVTVANLDTVVAAHIHPGVAGVAGRPLIDFSGRLSGGPLQSDASVERPA